MGGRSVSIQAEAFGSETAPKDAWHAACFGYAGAPSYFGSSCAASLIRGWAHRERLLRAASLPVRARFRKPDMTVTSPEMPVAIVTGAAMGIGYAIAHKLAERGSRIVIVDRADAAGVAARLVTGGFEAIGIEADVSSEKETADAAKAAETAFGRIDVLVNNAGIYSTLTPRTFDMISVEEFRRVMDVNVLGVFLCCRAVLPALRRAGGGRIVNISSGVAFKGNPLMAHYVASKGAVISFTRALATELGADGITVNSVAPGFTLSEGVERNPELIAGVKGPSLRNRVLSRNMVPDDVVGAVAFFTGPDSAFITGQTLVVDGGAYFH
jgi:NAD(P)-dependent dehydrogenase (short-subunit alcohol dehydrogenase family)